MLVTAGITMAGGVKVDAGLPSYTTASGVSGNIKSVGSDTMNNLMALWAEGFRAQTDDNKTYQNNVAIAKHSQRDRWILTAWRPCNRTWGNKRCPCLHSDPIFPDCAPGETVYCHGRVLFHEGHDIE